MWKHLLHSELRMVYHGASLFLFLEYWILSCVYRPTSSAGAEGDKTHSIIQWMDVRQVTGLFSLSLSLG
jgi:hypothetical protein